MHDSNNKLTVRTTNGAIAPPTLARLDPSPSAVTLTTVGYISPVDTYIIVKVHPMKALPNIAITVTAILLTSKNIIIMLKILKLSHRLNNKPRSKNSLNKLRQDTICS